MKIVFIDTSIFINAEKPMSKSQDSSGNRHIYSKELLNFLKNNTMHFVVYYDPRVEKEVVENKEIIKKFRKSNSYILNDTYDQVDYAFWEEIESKWGYDKENKLADEIEIITPEDKNRFDRNIYTSAVYQKCKVFIHDDKGFRSFNNHAKSNNIKMLHLRDYLLKSIEELLGNLK